MIEVQVDLVEVSREAVLGGCADEMVDSASQRARSRVGAAGQRGVIEMCKAM